jgi:MinD superfamily P-loop ATPase
MLEGKKLNRVMERLKKINIPVLCSMPYDSELDEAIFNGDSLFQFHSSPVFEQIDIILDKLGGKDGNT